MFARKHKPSPHEEADRSTTCARALELVKLISVGAKPKKRGLSGEEDDRTYFLALYRDCLKAVRGD